MEEPTASTASTIGEVSQPQQVITLSDDVITRIAEKAALLSSNLIASNNRNVCDMVENALKANEKAVKYFKNAGNQHQYDHARSCLSTLEAAEKYLERADVDKAKTVITSGKSIIKKRMKLIRLADRDGWATVKEYISDDLASDSADEKNILKSIKGAEAKKGKGRKASKFRNAPLSYRSQRFSPPRNRYRSNIAPSKFNKPRREELRCWTCGKLGHFNHECYSNNPGSSSSNKFSRL